jgi:Amt family ammonium transporter
VHGVGGIMGSLLVAVLGTAMFGGTGVTDIAAQAIAQVKGVGFTLIWSAAGTLIIIAIVKATVGLRIDQDVEEIGLDQSEHGETAYHPE